MVKTRNLREPKEGQPGTIDSVPLILEVEG